MATKAAPKKNLSALKRVRQAETHRLRNQAVKTKIKTCEKKLDSAIASQDREEIDRARKIAEKTVSTAASKGIIHSNTAARKISRIAKRVNALAAPAPQQQPE